MLGPASLDTTHTGIDVVTSPDPLIEAIHTATGSELLIALGQMS